MAQVKIQCFKETEERKFALKKKIENWWKFVIVNSFDTYCAATAMLLQMHAFGNGFMWEWGCDVVKVWCM